MLPLVVIDHIFSYLRKDPATLAKCSILQHDISSIAERHLYGELLLGEGCAMGCHRLVQLLSRRPHVGNYVRRLRIVGSKELCVRGRPVGFLDVEAFPMLRDKLPCLQSIEIAPIYRRKSTPWSAIDHNVQTTILSLFRQSTVREATIRDIVDFPLNALDGCHNIRRMLLLGKLYYYNLGVRSASHQLDFLLLERYQASLIPWIESHPPSVLDLHVNKTDANALQKVIEVCSETISKLTLTSWEFRSDLHTTCDVIQRVVVSPNKVTLNFGSLSGLEHLHFKTIMLFSLALSTTTLSTPLPAIVHALSTLPSSCPLKVVTIYVAVRYLRKDDLCKVDWSPLYTSPSLFEVVPRVHLQISATHSSSGVKAIPPDEVISMLSKDVELMKVVEKGLVVLTAEDEWAYI